MARARMLRLLVAGALVAGSLALVATGVPPAVAAPSAAQIVLDEAYWISLAQVPPGRGVASGAIARYRITPTTRAAYVSPYDGTVGAMGMLAGGARYHPMVKAWMEWYLRSFNWPDYNGVYGTVYDHWVDPVTGTQRPVIDARTGLPVYDSTDAYAGIFLSLARRYAEAVPADRDFLRRHRYHLDVLANVVIATSHPNGLTGARPDWDGEYLLDNIESERGLADYAWIAREVLGDARLAAYWQDQADVIGRAVERFIWFPDRQMYGWASDQPSPSWSVFYPDSVVQAWPIIHGYGSPERRQALWSAFQARWPRWTTSADNPGTPDPQPWASLAYAAAVQGERAQVLAWLEGSERTWVARGRPFPWSVNDSAWRALTAVVARDRGWG